GQANPAILDSVSVDSYGTKMPIKNVASISIEDSKTIRISPWVKNQIKDMEKAILEADLGLSIVSDGDGVRVIFPMLTTETRQNFVKLLKDKLEDARINVRKIRQDFINKLTDLTEDEIKKEKEDIQKLVDEANKSLEDIFSKKEKEVLS
ncbi:MAG: ribosome recycling factor, partial [Patescibacteria group bacterium]|nr:ribosome recycling factor [Patescibacteria group bacterium]